MRSIRHPRPPMRARPAAPQDVRLPLALAALCGGSHALAQSCLWTQGSGPGIPGARFGAAMAFDSARARTVLFGGGSPTGPDYGDTWEWDGAAWLLRATSGPGPDDTSVMAYDAGRARTVLFRPFNGVQTWEWDGQAWTLANSGAPGGTGFFSSLFFDTHLHTTSMLRINVAGSQLWDWNGSVWTQRTAGAGLPGNYFPVAAFDSARNRLVAFISREFGSAQTWEFDDAVGTWTMIPIAGPPARESPVIVYDPVNARTILYGGYGPFNYLQQFRESWEWNAAGWTLTSNAGPGTFQGASAAFDSVRARMVLFGTGLPGTNQTWEYNAAAANPAVIITQQPARILIQPGQSASFHVVATGAGPLLYRWRRDGQPLSDGGNISGSATPDLTIGPATGADTGSLDVLITDVCGTVVSDTGSLTVQVPCYANCDQSTVPPILNANDFSCFIGAYAGGVSYANCDGSTGAPMLTGNDYVCFISKFAVGCTG